MKYMLLIYQNPANWQELPDGERDAIMSDAGAMWRSSRRRAS